MEGRGGVCGVVNGKNAKTECACLCVEERHDMCVVDVISSFLWMRDCVCVKAEDRDATVGNNFHVHLTDLNLLLLE